MTAAQRLYSVLFDGPLPAVLSERFAEAWRAVGGDYSSTEHAELERVLGWTVDLEALELACRFHRRLPILTDQLRIMTFLAETLPGHFSDYVELRPRPQFAAAAVCYAGVRTALKYLKGRYLLWRLDVR